MCCHLVSERKKLTQRNYKKLHDNATKIGTGNCVNFTCWKEREMVRTCSVVEIREVKVL